MPARKYAKLVASLEELRAEMEANHEVRREVSFEQVAGWAAEPLPPAAYKHRPWWSNNRNNDNSNRPWDRAYFRIEDVDMNAQTVVFRKLPLPPPSPLATKESIQRLINRVRAPLQHNSMSDVAQPFTSQLNSTHHPVRGALKGTIRITVDVDLTAPADPEWADRP